MADDGASERHLLDFLAGGGEMGERTRGLDWSRTPLGPVENWPQSLRSALSICLNSSFPIALYWGSELVLLYNDDWRPIPGEKHPGALGRPAREVWPEIWDTIGPLFEEVVTTGRSTRRQDQLLPMRRHGFTEECYFDYSFSPVRGERGDVDGVFNAVVETTSRVVGERRLRTLRELAARTTEEAKSAEDACRTAARLLADNPHDLPFALLYLLDEDERRATLAGHSGVESGTPISPAAVDLDDGDVPWPFRQVVETGEAVEVHDLSGRFGPLPGGPWPEPSQRAVVLPMSKPGQAHLAGFVVAGVSPRLALNDDYRGFMALLAGHVATAVANARAYEEERRRAEALAELDRSKTAFFSNVSHEFRTPLTLMLGPVEDMLARSYTELSPAAKGQLEVVSRNGLRLLRLVNSLLDFSRIEAGRVRAAFQPTDLAAFTADLASVFRAACERAGLRLTVDCEALPGPAYVDRDMWEKVVLNLLSNAFKFTFEGEIAVTLRQAGGDAELRVRDTGTGIPAEEMPRLFERFHRVENARGRTHEGSGIGLALVQELVKLHGGSIFAESVVGEGTTFVVTLPLGSAHLPAEQIGDGRSSASTASGAGPFVEEALRWLPDEARGDDGRSELPSQRESLPVPARGPEDDGRPRVLVADDNADMRQYVVRLLAEQFRVEAAADGEAALAAARERTPDLVLTDVMMPRLDGFGLLRELRADPRTSGVPVIMLSARAGEESRVEGMEAGADDYLVKPFSAKELSARVGAHLQMARLRRESNEALRRGEERLRMALTAARMAAWEYNPATDEVTASDNLAELYGLPPGSTIESGEQGFPLVHPDDSERHRAAVKNAVARCGSYLSRFRLTRPADGREIWLEERGHALRDQPGGAVRLVGVVTDITERERSEETLRQSEEFNRSLMEGSPDCIKVLDTDGRLLHMNAPGLCSMEIDDFGQACGRLWSGLWPEGSREEVRRAVASACGGRTYSFQAFCPTAKGSPRWWDVAVSPVRNNPGGPVARLLAVSRDITERKRAEQDLQRERDLLSVTLASIGDAVITTDTEGNVTNLNAVAETLTGWTAAEAAGVPLTTVFDIVNEETRAAVQNPALRALRDGVIVGLANHTILIAKDGTERPIDDSAAPIRASGGETLGSVLVFREITERRAAEQALRESEARYRLVGEAANDAIWDWDLVTNAVAWNPGVRTMFGYAEHEVGPDGDWWIDHVHPDDRRRISEGIHAVIDGSGERWSGEYRFRRSDGSYAVVFDRGRVVRDGTGKPVRMVGSMLDLTERNRREEELRDVRRRLEAALEAGEIGTWIWDMAEDRVFADRNLARMFSVTPGEAEGGSLAAYTRAMHPEDAGRVGSLIDEAAEAGDRYEAEYRVVGPDGGIRWLITRGVFERDDDGRPVRMPGVAVDITERRQAEERLRVSEERFRTLFDTMDEGFCVVEMAFDSSGRATDYRIVEMNPAFERHTGLKGIIGKSVREAIPGLEEYWYETYGRVASTGEPTRFVNRAGPMEDRWFDVYAFRLGGDGSDKVAILFNDITARKDAEEELRRVAADLSESDRRKTEFIATLGHELRNPLAPIRTGLELMKMLADDPAAMEETRSMMERQAQQMVRLIDDLLEVSRITQGKLQLRKARVELSEVVRSAVEASRPFIDEAGHELAVALPPQPILLDADPNRLAQVFSNLLNNSAKYTPDGGRIRLSAERQGSDVVVTVADNGIGIPAEMQAGVFEMFSQIDRPLEKGYKGLGIGLTLVRRLVEMHGGRVDVRSDGEGKGSEFSVRLPIRIEPQPAKSQSVQAPPAAKPTGFRILVVDDNRDAANMLSMVVRMLGNEVRIAHDGGEAVEAAEMFLPDVVLMDLGMPKMNGYEAARRIRQREWGRNMTLVALTGWGQDEDKQRTKDAGFDHHLVKPAEPAALQKLLADLRPDPV